VDPGNKPNLTRVCRKFNSLVSKANTAGNVLGQAVQHAAEKLAGKTISCNGS